MCTKPKLLPDREELVEKNVELEQENRKLWLDLKQKQNQIVAQNDKIILQEDLLKSRAELKRLLSEYLATIRSLQRNVTFLQNENKILEQRFYKGQMTLRQLTTQGYIDQKEWINENVALKLKLHGIEKEFRRYKHLWDKNTNIAAEIMTAQETIMNLEQKLMECQPLASECKQAKNQLSECEQKLKSATYTSSILKDELHQAKAKAQEIANESEELKKQTTKYTELITRLKEENTSMEHFVEKSFRLEGALAELDDLNVVLKKQESMLGVLFDENQSLKEGISHLFDEINVLKDRNWKLERYANDMEHSYYKAEKNTDALEHRLSYFQTVLSENDRMKLSYEDITKRNRYLEETNNTLMTKLADVEKNLYAVSHALNMTKEENQKLIKDTTALKAELMNSNRKFILENDILKGEYEKQKALASKYSGVIADFKTIQRKFGELQEINFKSKEDMRKMVEQNSYFKDELDALNQQYETTKQDRDKLQKELKNSQMTLREAEAWIKQLEYQLNRLRNPVPS
ncbi:myosin-11-like [Planococcus citri]|uniref:myosin-11-like n=1 Tax=Planococcus citri TaxID=170843 RepID=UPI0031F91977